MQNGPDMVWYQEYLWKGPPQAYESVRKSVTMMLIISKNI